MVARVMYFVVTLALLVGLAVVAVTGGQLMASGQATGIGIGISAEVLVGLALWFVWKTFRFGRDSQRLSRILEAEGGLPVDELKHTPGGGIDRDSADAVFAKRKAETEAAPEDWRSWFRLAVAYADARDTPRARKAMERAIKLQHEGAAR
jgi:cytochrome c-type biogenesis protein CcmH/NrfG